MANVLRLTGCALWDEQASGGSMAPMERRTHALLNQALTLPEGDRADLAAALLESLEPSQDAEIEAAWKTEVATRVAFDLAVILDHFVQIVVALCGNLPPCLADLLNSWVFHASPPLRKFSSLTC
jgi:hypothetical protein